MSAAARWAMDSDDEVEEAEAEDDPETLQRKAERETKAIQVLKEAEKLDLNAREQKLCAPAPPAPASTSAKKTRSCMVPSAEAVAR